MPFYHKPRGFTPLAIIAEKKSVKNGLHHAVFTSRFDSYVGDWKNDKKEGKGRFVTIGGKLFEGNWYKGSRHGFGILCHKLQNGTYQLRYRGEWAHGKYHGVGYRYYDNGDLYLGNFKHGHRQGYGKIWYADGTYYVGYWKDSKKHGLGMFVQKDGNRYEGNWNADLKHGLGRFYHLHTGQLQEGCWVQNVCVKSQMSDIIIRQFCERPTEYPIPPHELKNARKLLENSELWLNMELGDIDKNLRFCIDKM